LLERLGYSGASASADYSEAFEYIRAIKHIPQEAVGTGAWNDLDIEEIFTAVELEREFCEDESDEYSSLTIIRNKLLRYVGRIIALCTQGGCGERIRKLAESLDIGDSVLTFNWDLLLDYELGVRGPKWQYHNFFTILLQDFRFGGMTVGPYGHQGMFLKLHGSFNWYRCTNRLCRNFSSVAFYEDTQNALDRLMGIAPPACEACGSQMNPLLIPPLLKKPINENATFKAIWGVARQKIVSASKVVIIGFSLPPTDFYASWLLRSIRNPPNQVFVVNPMNDPTHTEHEKFKQRMLAVLPRGYNEEFASFAEIDEILARVRQDT